MLKNDYSRITEKTEELLAEVNLFSIVSNLKEVSNTIDYISQNMDSFVMFEEDEEETERILEKLEEIQEDFRNAAESLEDNTFQLISLVSNLVFLTDEEKKELLEEK